MIKHRLASTAALALMALPAAAQEAPATISTGASYSSVRGALAFIAFDADDILGSGFDAHVRLDKGEDGQAGYIRLGKTFELGRPLLGAGSYLRFSVDGAASEWDSDDYQSRNLGIELGLGAAPSDFLDYEVRLFGRTDTLSGFGPDVSPLVLADTGTSNAIGIGFNAVYSTFDTPVLPHSGVRFGTDLALATAAGDREWLAWSASAAAALPMGEALTLAMRTEGGMIDGRGGQSVSIVDRAFIGNPDPRGFAAGGLGPRDFVDGSVDTALGGNRYVVGSLELRYQTGRPELTVGIFADAGALWDLDETAGGASGTIDDGFHLRSAAGVSVYWKTQLGLLTGSIAQPINKQANDQTETFSFGIRSSF